jgi:hypothetical protein
VRIFPALFLLALCSGCQTTRDLYNWGRYEPLTYATLAKPHEISFGEQTILLEEDIEIGRSKDLLPPPGLYAHLAYLYLQAGDVDSAVGAFQREKELYPESEVFVDQMLNKLINPVPLS